MSELLAKTIRVKDGFRLQRLEVYNWGTFDSSGPAKRGEVHCIEPGGETTLLIGRNGSGKSTLVDAVLTLLVRPSVRNYNVAAGAKKRERDERSYICGAFDRRRADGDSGVEVQYLRPGRAHYSVLLGCFHNERSDQTFTLAQVLFVTADGKADRLYCFADSRRSISADCSSLTRSGMRQQLKERGFRVTASYTEYHEWFRKKTGVRQKAMDMLNQTVAVKDIQRLTTFIREHMLESRPWDETVESLLTHFSQLSEAHQSLLRVRDQLSLLEPVEKAGRLWQKEVGSQQNIDRTAAATEAFFHSKALELWEPEHHRLIQEVQEAVLKKDELRDSLAERQRTVRQLENDIENAGNQRLRELPALIAEQERAAAAAKIRRERFHRSLAAAQITDTAENVDSFERIRKSLPAQTGALQQKLTTLLESRDEFVVESAANRATLQQLTAELSALQQHSTNVPESLIEIRQQICSEFDLDPAVLPFAAELISIREGEEAWAPAIETVLNEFAVSLMVPADCFEKVSHYINSQLRMDSAHPETRISFLEVRDRHCQSPSASLSAQSLIRKLKIREGHRYSEWLGAELEYRFDYQCLSSLEELQATTEPGITAQCYLRNDSQHMKDHLGDAPTASDFVLGWDNTDKRRHLQHRILELKERRTAFEKQLEKLSRQEADCRSGLRAIETAGEIRLYREIDDAGPARHAASLQSEQEQLEQANDAVRLLRERLTQARLDADSVIAERDAAGISEGRLRSQLELAERRLADAHTWLGAPENQEFADSHGEAFGEVEAYLSEELTIDNLDRQEQEVRRKQDDNRRSQSGRIQPLQNQLVRSMARFLARFPEERSDLEASTEYLGDFLHLLGEIRSEDLPRHEGRFRERLNDKVTREIGLLSSELEKDRYAIIDRIDQLNSSLQQLEYRPGTHMKLEARPVVDPEIQEFQSELSACLEGLFSTDAADQESRYQRIERLLHRLRDEDRWRNKVIDVRRWFDFAAREVDDATGDERSYYEDSTGQSGGEKAKLAFTILVAAIAYQYDLQPDADDGDRLRFVVVDEMFSRIDDQYAEYALNLFRRFGLQLLIVAPLDAKARITEQHVGCYVLVTKDEQSRSQVHSMTARELEDVSRQADSEPAKSALI